MLTLIRYRGCESNVLQLDCTWGLAAGRRVADRRCPDGGTRDSAILGTFATELWLARVQRLRLDLMKAAEDLARGTEQPVLLSP